MSDHRRAVPNRYGRTQHETEANAMTDDDAVGNGLGVRETRQRWGVGVADQRLGFRLGVWGTRQREGVAVPIQRLESERRERARRRPAGWMTATGPPGLAASVRQETQGERGDWGRGSAGRRRGVLADLGRILSSFDFLEGVQYEIDKDGWWR